MFLFKMKISSQILFFIVLLILTSCSSLDKKSIHTTIKKNDLVNEKKDEKGKTNKVEGEDGVVKTTEIQTMVDPMADIQINAEIKKSYSKVSKLNKTKNYTEGLNELERIKLKYPQLSGPDYQKARLYFNQSQYNKALQAVELSLKNNGRNYYSLNLKGIILKELGEFKEAKNTYLKAIATYNLYANTHLNLGVLSDVYTGELDLALVHYKEYIKLSLANKSRKGKVLQVKEWVVELDRRIKQVKK
jgi:tetratricopeptide (TPR) repeat protein